tara:strand:+ start:353 stop:922 length:570 start_codon:yes stop_codon:yes gene_type:complete
MNLKKRSIDIIFCTLALLFLILPLILISILVFVSSRESIIFFSKRVGKNGKIFNMPKFRTMKSNTPQVASHLIKDPDKYITNLGKFLRQYSLDELPQIFSVIFGSMSIVGPRPALFNQHNLITLRSKMKIDRIKPGITGWAQINGRDQLSVKEKVKLDEFYLKNISLKLDFYIILMTLKKVKKKQDISH